ncbi:hypothetical protein AB1Y20_019869 [Prymnesium parvum]|uniref:Uncharacterized protein n=1 Tax=Prymnesium parvum TaxID=97485 RepID=A0AB34JVP5_PRYPA
MSAFADIACPNQPTAIAVVIAGSLRSFTRPLVYTSMRHNLLEALGGHQVVFLYGKLMHHHLANAHVDAASAVDMKSVEQAVAYLSGNGSTTVELEIEDQSAGNHSFKPVPPPCYLYPSTQRSYLNNYVGQLHSNYMGIGMVKTYEEAHNMSFSMVVRVRPDTAFMRSVQPHCTYSRTMAYMSHPEPADWMMILPRYVAEFVLHAPFQYYLDCWRHANETLRAPKEAHCCGGGRTALMVGGVMESGAPLAGPPWPWGGSQSAPPVGSAVVPHLFHAMVVRDRSHDQWCDDLFLLSRPDGHPDVMQIFSTPSECRKVLSAKFITPHPHNNDDNKTQEDNTTMHLGWG